MKTRYDMQEVKLMKPGYSEVTNAGLQHVAFQTFTMFNTKRHDVSFIMVTFVDQKVLP